jgi:hypothetical protein
MWCGGAILCVRPQAWRRSILASRTFKVRTRVLTIGAALALAAAVLVVAAPTAIGGPPSCAVSNARTHKDYNSVQAGVDAVKAGDTLEVKGTCVGSTSVDRTVTLKGVTNKAFPGTPTLDGNKSGTVLHITNGTTTVDGLKVTNGVADVTSVEGNGCCVGGGIAVSGDTAGATLVNALVTGNSASIFGGGIDVDDGTLTLVNSTVSGNTAGSGSGGIDSDFGTITLTGSTVSGNTARRAGGIWNFGGTLTLRDSTVSGNSASAPLPRGVGGGIINESAGPTTALLTLSGSTTITGNHADNAGGGIFMFAADPGTVQPTADWTGSISGNTPDQCNPTLTIGSTTCSS